MGALDRAQTAMWCVKLINDRAVGCSPALNMSQLYPLAVCSRSFEEFALLEAAESSLVRCWHLNSYKGNVVGRPLMSNPATMNAAVPVQPRNYEYVPVNYEYVPAGLEVGLVCRR